MTTLAKEIKRIRKYWGLTQKQLATHAGISRSLLAMAETGKRRLSLRIKERIMNYKPLVWPSAEVDVLLAEQQSYIRSKTAALAYEAQKAVARKQEALRQMKRKFEVLLEEWSAIIYRRNFLGAEKYDQRHQHSVDTLAKLKVKLMNYDFIAQYQLKKQIRLLETSEPYKIRSF